LQFDFDSTETKRKKLEGENTRPQRNDIEYVSTVPKVTEEQFMEGLNILSKLNDKLSVVVTKIEFGAQYATPDKFEIPKLAEMYSVKFKGMSLSELRYAAGECYQNFILSDIQIEYIFVNTQEQFGCSLWPMARVGRITASVIGDILCTHISDFPSMTYVNKICFPCTQSNSRAPALLYGRTNEQLALDDYQEKQTSLHLGFKLQKSGIKIKSDAQFIAASPDGLTYCECCGVGIVEVKCPYSIRDCLSIAEFVGKKSCYFTFEKSDLKLNKNHRYYFQVQCQLAVFTEASFCDFVVWNKQDFAIQRIYPDKKVQDSLLLKAECYFFDIVAPQLMANYFTKKERVVFGNLNK